MGGTKRAKMIGVPQKAPLGWPKTVAWNPSKVLNAMKYAKLIKEKNAKMRKKLASTTKYKGAMLKAAASLKALKLKLKNAKRPKIVKKVVKKVVKKGGKRALAKEKEKAAKLAKRKGARALAKKEKEKAAKLALKLKNAKRPKIVKKVVKKVVKKGGKR